MPLISVEFSQSFWHISWWRVWCARIGKHVGATLNLEIGRGRETVRRKARLFIPFR